MGQTSNGCQGSTFPSRWTVRNSLVRGVAQVSNRWDNRTGRMSARRTNDVADGRDSRR
jgi:hypothetical protein